MLSFRPLWGHYKDYAEVDTQGEFDKYQEGMTDFEPDTTGLQYQDRFECIPFRKHLYRHLHVLEVLAQAN
jgi:hypothetical protein